MKIRTFNIRMDDHLQSDEETLNAFMETVTIKKTATEFVTDKVNYWSIIVYYDSERMVKSDSIMSAPSEKISFPSDSILDTEERIVFNALQRWRNDIAIKTSLPGYMICNKSELVTISKVRPKSLEELGKIKGFSSKKILKYGNDVLALLNSV